MGPVPSMFVQLIIHFSLIFLLLVNCFKKRNRRIEGPSFTEKESQKETEKLDDTQPTSLDASERTTSASVDRTTTSSYRERQVEDHTGDTYKELRPRSDVSKNLLSVVHLDRTDMIVPAGLSQQEQRILLRAMSKGSKRVGLDEGLKETTIDKVITFATSDDITDSESPDPPGIPDDLQLDGTVHLDNLLIRMIQNGPRQFKFGFNELKDLLSRGTDVFAAECSLLDVKVPCVIYGDIHGQYSDLHRWFNLNGWPNRTRTVFLGDFVDRGSHGIEVIAMLTLLKLHFPDRIFVVRGNHEEESLNKAYSFYEEVVARFAEEESKARGQQMYECFKTLFMNLPLAVLVGKRILGMHGGISPKMRCLQDIRNIKRPIDDFEVGSLECDLVWSDPDTGADTQGFRPNLEREPQHGIGQLFGPESVKDACDRLGIDLMIRGHQAPLYGYAFFAEGRMMTLFSAPGYKGSNENDVNMGACVEVNNEMLLTIKQLKVSTKFRKNRVADMERAKNLRKKILK
ncbi:unnamed protein product [Bursaphelenchus xylophilus]|uniref:Serine/threonine-protein phosphatase n=1 Tax=Bursaphelenchus xylophilus TaxID=6326 RepID=A0A1I7SLV4_BURXY|nr:unnamed protein product [Bursaphelenchus xylophilus]CAG9129864.1 unnamed protein product [Bursaphelenchus xylophilus]